MKKFIIRALLFVCLFVFVYTGLIVLNFFLVRNLSFQIGESKTVVVTGASQAAAAVDEKLIPHTFNTALSGDAYFNQVIRLRYILGKNPQVKTLLISVTPINLLAESGDTGDFGLANENSMSRDIKLYYPLHSVEERGLYLEREPLLYFKNVLIHPLQVFNAQNDFFLSALGGYRSTSAKVLDRSVKRWNYEILKNRGKNLSQVRDLKRILELAQLCQIKPILVSMPLYRAENFFDMDTFYRVLKEEFPDVEFWDYSNFPLGDDCRQDINHLNRWGAEIFSRELAERMKREGIVPADS